MKTYQIKSGNHRSGIFFRPFLKSRLSFCAKFSQSCIYNFNTVDQFDINKLMGFSRGLHHHNSARIGWRSKEDKIEIVSYCYINKIRIQEETLAIISPEENIYCSIFDKKTSWIISVQTISFYKKIEIPKDNVIKFGYMLFPYFGGNMTAPNNMEINIEINN